MTFVDDWGDDWGECYWDDTTGLDEYWYGRTWDQDHDIELTRIDEMLSSYDCDGEFFFEEDNKLKSEPKQVKLRGERSYRKIVSQFKKLLSDRYVARTHNDGPPPGIQFIKYRMKKIERLQGKKILQQECTGR